MTTVSQRDGLTLGQALAFWASGRRPAGSARPGVPAGEVPRRHREIPERRLPALRGQRRVRRTELPEVPQGRHRGEGHRPRPVGWASCSPATPSTPSTAPRPRPSRRSPAILKATKPGQEIVIDYRRKNSAPGTARITLGHNDDRDYGYLGHRRAGRPVGAVHRRLQPGQHRRPVGRADVQPGRRRQADHRRPQRRRSSSPAPAPSARTATSARSAASPTRCPAPRKPGRRCSWCPPTTATRPAPRPATAMELVKVETLPQAIDALQDADLGRQTTPLLSCVELARACDGPSDVT